MKPLPDFEGARTDPSPAARLKDLRARARRLRERLLAEPPVPYYRSFDLVRVPYPTRYGLLDACTVPTPFLHILNRMFVIQFPEGDRIATLLVSPSDLRANEATPFFADLLASWGRLAPLVKPAFGPTVRTVPEALASIGLEPGQVDYLSYDHLHTQDLRGWLGDGHRPGLFPHAKLLVMRAEWESAQGLLPPQRRWYCPDGVAGVPAARVVLLDGDVSLGPGVALVRTPGHTAGNHSFVVRTPEGLMVTSENGIGPDAYAPARSAIPGVAAWARRTGMEVVLNGNTLEGGLEQYCSMVVEKELAGPSVRHPDFPNVVSSSELAAWPLFPGLAPTFAFGELAFGTPVLAPPAGVPV